MPIIRLSEAVRRLAAGEQLTVVANKTSMLADIPAWLRLTNNQLDGIEHHGDLFRIRLTRTAGCRLAAKASTGEILK